MLYRPIFECFFGATRRPPTTLVKNVTPAPDVERRTFRTIFSSSARRQAKKLPQNLKNRTKSSQEWLTRHLNDPYVKRANMENYRARSAFKLIEVDDRFGLLRPGQLVVDCGAAPGAWTQVATDRVNARNIDPSLEVGKVISVDLSYVSPIEGAVMLSHADFTSPDIQRQIVENFGRRHPDVVLSDMAPNASGLHDMDNENIVLLATAALAFAVRTLNVGGHFLCKVWDGSGTKGLEASVEKFFETMRRVKPKASRSDSAELFLLGRRFRGLSNDN